MTTAMNRFNDSISTPNNRSAAIRKTKAEFGPSEDNCQFVLRLSKQKKISKSDRCCGIRNKLNNKFLAPMVGFGIIMVTLIIVFMPQQEAYGQTSLGRKVIRLDAIKVEGRIQKPQAFYILQRSSLNFKGMELKKSFVHKIVETLKKEPF